MHQAIQFMIADMATDIERPLLAWKSAVLLDQGSATRCSPLTPSASLPTSRCASRPMPCRYTAVRLHQGLPGREADARRKIMQLYEGTAQIQRM